MKTKTLDWSDTGWDRLCEESRDGRRYIGVADGWICSGSLLPQGMTAAEALEAYASTYDAGEDSGDEIEVWWRVFEDGEETATGRHTFEAR